ncbi:MAG: hypothetical protein NC187_02180 [Candidatus Amulumruptor caecigallinarius]|nr:hypothetical protein [Candidatus Amulumruptor caecigallinarius]MCM1396285.1 hypothetical protein [Candidatus Amulumruptor caecigallinarius]MCM1454279.1 hypothetical protein [bacterium]
MPSIPEIFCSILRFIGGFFQARNYNLRNFAAYVLVIMVIQYIPLESRAGVSPVKVATMAILPLFLIANFHLNPSVICGSLYWLWVFFTSYVLHPMTFRASTVFYNAMFVITFMTLYTLIYDRHIFTIDWFIVFLRRFIWVLAGFCVAQQILLVLGVWYFPPLNMVQWLFTEGSQFRVNSLSYEPSSFARSVGVLYYAYLKCNEYLTGQKLSIATVFNQEHRWVTIAALWSLATIGSGTAFVVIALVSLYFLKGYWTLLTAPLLVVAFIILRDSEIEAFQRMQATAEAVTTLDPKEVKDADTSAAVRVAPTINTIANFSENLNKEVFWVGHGCDYSRQFAYAPQLRQYGEIDDYGFIACLLGFLIVFCCCIRFFSIATIMFLLGVGGGLGNIAYSWGLLFILMATRYFSKYQILSDDYNKYSGEEPDAQQGLRQQQMVD